MAQGQAVTKTLTKELKESLICAPKHIEAKKVNSVIKKIAEAQ